MQATKDDIVFDAYRLRTILRSRSWASSGLPLSHVPSKMKLPCNKVKLARQQFTMMPTADFVFFNHHSTSAGKERWVVSF